MFHPTDYYKLNENLEIQTDLTTLPNEVVYTKDMLDTLSIIKQSNISIDIKAKLIDDLNKKALINYLDNIYAICLYKLYPEREISNETIKACINYGTLDLTKLEDIIDIYDYEQDDKYIVRIIEPLNDTWVAWRTDIIHSDKIKTVFALTNKTIDILSHKKQYHLWTALNTETAIKPEKQECCKTIKQEVEADYTVTEFTTFTHQTSLNKKVFEHSKELLSKRLMTLYDLETSRPSRNKHTQKLLKSNVLNIKPKIEDSKIVKDHTKKDFYTLSLYDPYYDIIYKMTASKKNIEKYIDIDRYNNTNNIAYKINMIMNVLLDPPTKSNLF